MAEQRRTFKRADSMDGSNKDADLKHPEEDLELKRHADDLASEKGGITGEKIVEAAAALTLAEARELIEEFCLDRELDPNFDQAMLKRAREILKEDDANEDSVAALVEEIKLEAALMEDSPYLEVRAATSNTDDPDEPVNTFRAWFLGLIFVTIGTGVNIFFAARNPAIALNGYCAQVIAYPIGVAMAKWLPTRVFNTFGWKWTLNPGPFRMKEHLMIVIAANVTFGGPNGIYATDVIFVQRLSLFFNEGAATNPGYQILMCLSTQMLGFGLAGFVRRFLVNPPSMIWPSALATVALNRSFHEVDNIVVPGWKITRLKFFTIVFVAYGFYFVFPQAVFSALSYFNWMTWISPNNVKLALLAGSVGGIGLNPIATLDWSYMSAINNPLISPLYSSLNTAFGLAFCAVCLMLPIYFTNTWYTAYLPINSADLFDNTGNTYNISSILSSDFTLNEAAYADYSPAYQSAGNAVAFFAYFALYPATLVHVFLYNRKEIATGFRAIWARRSTQEDYHDTHNKLMKAYREVPDWWFGIVMLISVVFGIVYNEIYKTQLPVWAIFFTIALGAIFIIPVGVIQALTNSAVTLNVVAEFICSYAVPNRPVANMLFKSYGFVSTAQAVQYVNDLKVGHYAKLPPRSLFAIQMTASVWACFVSLGVVDWQLKNISNICEPDQVNGFTCPNYHVMENSAVQFGAIGASRLYSQGSLYYPMVYGFLAGAVSPIPFYFLARKWPAWRLVNMPVFWNGGGWLAPYNISYVSMSSYIAWFFMGYVKRRHTAWWAKYTYILATALTSAVSIFGVVWFFAILYKGYQPDWWGNNVPFVGADGLGTALLAMPAVGYFGPPSGSQT